MADVRARHRMLTLLIRCAAALALPVLAWLWCTDVFLPRGVSRISLLYAADTFSQCSRSAPLPTGAYWMPSGSQVRAAELALKSFPQPKLDPIYDNSITHQYIGFTRGGRRLIYINVGLDDEPIVGSYERPARERLFALLGKIWPEEPLRMCDGGKHFWGVVFDPAAGRFEDREENGVA
jgi:hypothetical protein